MNFEVLIFWYGISSPEDENVHLSTEMFVLDCLSPIYQNLTSINQSILKSSKTFHDNNVQTFIF